MRTPHSLMVKYCVAVCAGCVVEVVCVGWVFVVPFACEVVCGWPVFRALFVLVLILCRYTARPVPARAANTRTISTSSITLNPDCPVDWCDCIPSLILARFVWVRKRYQTRESCLPSFRAFLTRLVI